MSDSKSLWVQVGVLFSFFLSSPFFPPLFLTAPSPLPFTHPYPRSRTRTCSREGNYKRGNACMDQEGSTHAYNTPHNNTIHIHLTKYTHKPSPSLSTSTSRHCLLPISPNLLMCSLAHLMDLSILSLLRVSRLKSLQSSLSKTCQRLTLHDLLSPTMSMSMN